MGNHKQHEIVKCHLVFGWKSCTKTIAPMCPTVGKPSSHLFLPSQTFPLFSHPPFSPLPPQPLPILDFILNLGIRAKKQSSNKSKWYQQYMSQWLYTKLDNCKKVPLTTEYPQPKIAKGKKNMYVQHKTPNPSILKIIFPPQPSST